MVGIILSVPLGIFLPIVILLLAGIVASVIFCLKQGVKKGKELQKRF